MAACEHCKHDPDTAAASLKQAKDALDIAKREAAKAIGDSAAKEAEREALAKFKAETEPQIVKLNGDLALKAQDVALARRGFTDEAKARGFRGAYSIYAAEAGSQAKAFDQWLDNEAKTDPFTAPHFAQPAAKAEAAPAKPAEPAPPATPAAKANPLPGSNAGAVADPGRQGAMSPQQLREFFQSPSFKKLPPEQQKAKRVELETQLRTARQAPV